MRASVEGQVVGAWVRGAWLPMGTIRPFDQPSPGGILFMRIDRLPTPDPRDLAPGVLAALVEDLLEITPTAEELERVLSLGTLASRGIHMPYGPLELEEAAP